MGGLHSQASWTVYLQKNCCWFNNNVHWSHSQQFILAATWGPDTFALLWPSCCPFSSTTRLRNWGWPMLFLCLSRDLMKGDCRLTRLSFFVELDLEFPHSLQWSSFCTDVSWELQKINYNLFAVCRNEVSVMVEQCERFAEYFKWPKKSMST